jgi:hypothetical protein
MSTLAAPIVHPASSAQTAPFVAFSLSSSFAFIAFNDADWMALLVFVVIERATHFIQ